MCTPHLGLQLVYSPPTRVVCDGVVCRTEAPLVPTGDLQVDPCVEAAGLVPALLKLACRVKLTFWMCGLQVDLLIRTCLAKLQTLNTLPKSLTSKPDQIDPALALFAIRPLARLRVDTDAAPPVDLSRVCARLLYDSKL